MRDFFFYAHAAQNKAVFYRKCYKNPQKNKWKCCFFMYLIQYNPERKTVKG